MQIPMAVNTTQEQQICEGFKLASSRDPKFYVPIDLVKLVAEFALKPPKEYDDVFMEKYTIFISKHSWQDILKISKEYLIQLGCECTIKNFSIECTFYNEQRCVNMHFHVNIFTSSDSEDEYVVEFRRRRSGDTLEFLELFAQFIQQDKGRGMVSRGKTEGFSFPQPRLPFNSPFGPIILDEDCIDCLLRQLNSHYYKVQAGGLCELARCVQTKANCVLMRRVPSIVSFLCSFLDINCPETTYPTLIILKFLLNPLRDSDSTMSLKEHKNLLSQLDLPKMDVLLGGDLGETCENLIHSVLKSYFDNFVFYC